MTGKSGERQAALKAATSYDGEDCLIWPYAKVRGYGIVWLDGRKRSVHRYVCDVVHGPAPTSKHEVAHSCGNNSCCNPKHLRWATSAENQADKLIHGTSNRGERHGCAKLTKSEALAIIGLRGEMSQNKLAARFGVSRAAIRLIHSGETWGWLGGQSNG